MTLANGHDRAAEIAMQLQARGLPVVGYHEAAGKIGMTFQLQDAPAKYTARCPVEDATADWFAEAYEVVA